MGGKQNIQKERLQINNMLITSLNPNYHSLRTPESFLLLLLIINPQQKKVVSLELITLRQYFYLFLWARG